MPNKEAKRQSDDLAMIEVATPALRSILAFCIYLRFGNRVTEFDSTKAVDKTYEIADIFIAKLKEDYSS